MSSQTGGSPGDTPGTPAPPGSSSPGQSGEEAVGLHIYTGGRWFDTMVEINLELLSVTWAK